MTEQNIFMLSMSFKMEFEEMFKINHVSLKAVLTFQRIKLLKGMRNIFTSVALTRVCKKINILYLKSIKLQFKQKYF